jgi:hypothetical protein
MADFVVATEQSQQNWLHSADIIVADAETADAAMRLAEELLRRYPGCVAACVLVRGRSS